MCLTLSKSGKTFPRSLTARCLQRRTTRSSRGESHNLVGTTIRLNKRKKEGEPFTNWLTRKIDPKLNLQFLDFECEGKAFAIIVIEQSYHKPVTFDGSEYVRLGENTKPLSSYPELARAIWMATGRRRFEDAVALQSVSANDLSTLLNIDTLYDLTQVEKPKSQEEITRKLCKAKLAKSNMQGGYDITNLGAILLANSIDDFPSIASKSIRVVKYSGRDKRKAEIEQEGKMGYAVGFSRLVKFIMGRLPKEEMYIDGVRRVLPIVPEIAIREVVANALIHQDFTVSGSSPIIDIYANRVEVTNPGNSLILPDRMLDDRRSRNERLASTMRDFHLCEERGGGLDKALFAIELASLPPLEFVPSEHSMTVVLYGPKPFGKMSRQEKIRACYQHCVLRFIQRDFMSNASLRERFRMSADDYQPVSDVISAAKQERRIAPADPDQGRKGAKYIPYWAA